MDIPQPPPDDAWDFIQNRIPEEKKRPIIPLWGRISGIIALVLLSFGVGYWANDGSNHKTENDELQISARPGNIQNKNISSEENIINQSNSNNNLNDNNSISSTLTENQNSAIHLTSFITETLRINAVNSVHPSFNQPYYALNSSEGIDLERSFKKFEIPMTASAVHHWGLYTVNHIADNYNRIPSQFLMPDFKDLAQSSLIQKDKSFKKGKNKPKMDFNRFHFSGFISPMALNTFVGSSMLSDDMSNYKTINNITLAYGMKGAYSLGPAIKVRTGISMIGFEQVTKNVPLTSQVAQSPNGSLQLANNNVTYKSNVRLNPQANPNKAGEVGISSFGDIKQQSQYVEIPLEAEVSLFQTGSIGISATGGGSTWLLSKNKIFVYTDGHTEELGKASNLNKAVLSANAGLKFDMKISDAVQVNVEPSFKYLFNPVNNIDEYNPYTIGVNAGVTVSLK